VASSLSARKRIRQNIRRRARNRWFKGQIKSAVKLFDSAIAQGKTDQAAEQLKAIYKKLDQVAAKGALHKNAAARKKARMTVRLNKAMRAPAQQ